MAKKKTKKQTEQEEFEAMRQRALRPFKPSITDESVREFEEKIREESIERLREMGEEVKESEMATIRSRAYFEKDI